MAFWGADTEQLQQQAELTGAGAKQIEDLAMRLSSTVSTVAWLGPDADDFRATWEGDLRQRLHEAAERLGDVKASKQHGARRRVVGRMPRWA